jgi:glycyl-tRNA synthetase beta subunit
MKKTTTVTAAAALVFATLLMAGCTSWFESPAKPANDAIAIANTHLKKAAALESEVASASAALQQLPYTTAGAKQAVKITAAATKALTSERKELDAAKAAMDGIAKLEVSEPFKQYARFESAAIDARVVLVDAESRLYNAMDLLYTALSKSSSNVDVQEMATAIEQMRQQVTTFADEAAKAAAAAADFFAANRLGG